MSDISENLATDAGIYEITTVLEFLSAAAYALVIILLARSARKRRREENLCDVFFEAIKDKKYRNIIAGMLLTLFLSAAFLLL